MGSNASRRTISSIYDAALMPNLWPAALGLAVDSVGGVGAAYYVWNKRTGQVEWLSMSGPLGKKPHRSSSSLRVLRRQGAAKHKPR
jgi:hypothetical protein